MSDISDSKFNKNKLSLKACAHWRGLPRGCSLAQSQDRMRSDVTHAIECNFTHQRGLIRCCLTGRGQMGLVESDHPRPSGV